MPLKPIQHLIVSAPSPITASLMLLALLEQGYLGPVARQAVGKLSSEQIYRLNLYLSLQTGGGAAIRYLKPAHASLLHPIIDYYAALATEAAKPLDLQRWLSVLQPAGYFGSSWELDIISILAEVQAALLCHEARPDILNRANDHLRSLIHSLYNLSLPTPPTEQLLQILPLSWPVALLLHLENHQRYLFSP